MDRIIHLMILGVVIMIRRMEAAVRIMEEMMIQGVMVLLGEAVEVVEVEAARKARVEINQATIHLARTIQVLLHPRSHRERMASVWMGTMK